MARDRTAFAPERPRVRRGRGAGRRARRAVGGLLPLLLVLVVPTACQTGGDTPASDGGAAKEVR